MKYVIDFDFFVDSKGIFKYYFYCDAIEQNVVFASLFYHYCHYCT